MFNLIFALFVTSIGIITVYLGEQIEENQRLERDSSLIYLIIIILWVNVLLFSVFY